MKMCPARFSSAAAMVYRSGAGAARRSAIRLASARAPSWSILASSAAIRCNPLPAVSFGHGSALHPFSIPPALLPSRSRGPGRRPRPHGSTTSMSGCAMSSMLAHSAADYATGGEDKGLFGSYPIRKVTTPVPVEGGMAGSALPMSPGTWFQGRRKPNGSACDRRTMAGSRRKRRSTR
jgi:hypothetical protein